MRLEGPCRVGRSLFTEPHSLPVSAVQPLHTLLAVRLLARLKGTAGLVKACYQSYTACQRYSLFTLCWL